MNEENQKRFKDLFVLLMKSETGIHLDNNSEIIFYVHISICNLSEFTSILGSSLNDYEIPVRLFSNSLYVELNDVFSILDLDYELFSDCFDEKEFKEHVLNFKVK